MVKNIFLICICSGFICFLCVACRDRDVAKSFPEDISGTAVSGNYPIVVDETGKERELKLGDVDVEDRIKNRLYDSLSVGYYSQIQGNHYYYLRGGIKKNNLLHYEIYCDQRQKIGEFVVDRKEYYVTMFGKIGKQFYALVEYGGGDEDIYDDRYTEHYYLARVNLKKQRTERLSDFGIVESRIKNDSEFFGDTIEDVVWYGDSIYCEIDFIEGKKIVQLDSKYKNPKDIYSCCNEEESSRFYMDGKIYYRIVKENNKLYEQHKQWDVYFYCYDLKSGKKEEILNYRYKTRMTGWEPGREFMDIDEDYVYLGEDLIPRAGGEIIRLKTDGWGDIVHNQNYIFYIQQGRIRRMDKKTKEDKEISDIQVVDIECTEKGLYVQVDKGEDNEDDDELEDDEDDDELDEWVYGHSESYDLYYMDFDGRNKKKIYDKKQP